MQMTMAWCLENAIGFFQCRRASGGEGGRNRSGIVVLAVIGFIQLGGVSWSLSPHVPR
jgi:hypothetical protein